MSELRALLRLAIPIIIAQVGMVLMGVVGTWFVAPLGADALSALALGNTIWFLTIVAGMGVVMGMDTWVSQAWGRGDRRDCARGLAQGRWLALFMTPPLLLAEWAIPQGLHLAGYDPHIVALAESYLGPLMWGVYPMLLFAAYRSFLASVNVTRPLLLAAALGNVANALLCFWLVGGGLGLAAQGALGVAWSTSICRVVLLLPLALIVHFRRDFKQFPQVSWAPDWPLLGRLARIGAPIGFQLSAEVGSFSAAAVLIGTFGTVALAAHQLAINVASMLFMVPLGLSAAAAVRTGNAFGRGDLPGMARAGWTSFGTGFAFAVTSALVLTLFPEAILSVFRPDQDVALIALDFLAVAALFQIGDSLQVVGMGVLRGLGDTRVSMIFVLLGYAGVAVPAGLLGAFVWSHDPRWIWGGLAIGLLVVAVLLVGRFRWQTTKVARERGAAAVVAAAAM